MARGKAANAPTPLPQRPVRDWEAIEREYRAGQLSVIEIGRQHKISHTAINKRAKAHGWQRDLAERVRSEVSARLVSEVSPEVSETNARAAVETAAARGVEVVRQHRGDIGRLRRIAAILGERLEAVISGESVEGVCVGDKESVSDVLEKLSRVSTRVVQLERQAFSLDKEPPGSAAAPSAFDASKLTDETLAALAAVLPALASAAGGDAGVGAGGDQTPGD